MKTLNRLSLALVFSLFLILVGLLINAIYPYKVLTVNRLPYPVKTSVVEASKDVIIDVDYCKYMSVPAYYSAQFIEHPSGATTTLQQKYVSNLDTGCKQVDFHVLSPEGLAPGKYNLRLNIEYPVNAFREVNYTFSSDEFEIIRNRSASDSANILWIRNTLSDWKLDEEDPNQR